MRYYSEETVKKIIADTINATLHICEPKGDYHYIEIKEPHGRLIQADEVKKLMQSGLSIDTYEDQAYVCSLINEIPTIIEASN